MYNLWDSQGTKGGQMLAAPPCPAVPQSMDSIWRLLELLGVGVIPLLQHTGNTSKGKQFSYNKLRVFS